MAKFGSRTCIVYAKYVVGGEEGLKSSSVDRDKIIQKDSDRVLKTQKIGTSKEVSEVNDKEVVVKAIESKVISGDGLVKKESISEALFDVYLDTFTATGTAANTNISQQIATTISISEIKALESAWSDGTSTSFYDACKDIIGTNKNKTDAIDRINMYSFVKAVKKSNAIVDNNMFGDLDIGTGSDTCSSQATESQAFVTNFLLKGSGTGVYPNKPTGLSDTEWATLHSSGNFHIVEC